jgi:hypothetical protein
MQFIPPKHVNDVTSQETTILILFLFNFWLFNDTVSIAQAINLYLSLDVRYNPYCYVTENYADSMETDFWNDPE